MIIRSKCAACLFKVCQEACEQPRYSQPIDCGVTQAFYFELPLTTIA